MFFMRPCAFQLGGFSKSLRKLDLLSRRGLERHRRTRSPHAGISPYSPGSGDPGFEMSSPDVLRSKGGSCP